MRSLNTVITDMLKEIPEGHGLRYELEDNLDSLHYAAPESIGRWWRIVAENVNESLNFPPKEDWEWNVAAILMDKSVPEIKEQLLS